MLISLTYYVLKFYYEAFFEKKIYCYNLIKNSTTSFKILSPWLRRYIYKYFCDM